MKILNKGDVLKCRKTYRALSEEEQRSFIMSFFTLSAYHHQGKRHYTFRANGKEVCRKAWLAAHSISRTTFYRLQKEFERDGRYSPEGARKGRNMTKPSTLKAESWFNDYIASCADRIPNEDKYCLPTCLTKREVYLTYRDDLKSAGVRTVSWATFSRMWKKRFRNVIIPKENKFTKCGVCVALKLCLQGTNNKDKRRSLAYKRKIHNEQQMAERRAYYANCLKAELNPDQYLSLIIDGMDQSKTNLPHANCLSKDETYHFLRTHVTGAISHGHGRIFSYIDLMRWPHDSNLTLNVLLQIFVELSEEGRLPPYLFLQMDNCYRECKNRYILGFCSLLVEKGIFKEVRLSFLMVGHTHEDVDQFFSRISRRLHKKDSMTLPALVRNIHKAHTPAPDVHVLKYVFDIKAWLEPYLNSVKRHVYPHAYKFFKRDGQVTMRYKKWANDKTWLPDGPSLHMLNGKPRGIPVLVRPETKKLMDIKDLQESVKKCSRLTNEDQMWWSSFVNKEKAFRAKWATASADMLAKEKRSEWQLDKLKNHRPVKAPSETDPDQQQREETLENLLQKANHFPDVIVQEKRKNGETVQRKRRKTTNK
ncbi:uncharacterized protein LOC144631526 isoform X2 [Oculina patagonica]